jgi:type I restriction enzyme S subunit
VSKEVHEAIFARSDPEPGDILYIKDGATTGIVTVNDLKEPFSLLSSVALLKTDGLMEPWYACYAMRSPFFYDETRGQMTGVGIPRVTLRKLNAALLPVPPVSEQQRIIVRIRELMSLIAELEDRFERTEELQTKVARAFVNSLSRAPLMSGSVQRDE